MRIHLLVVLALGAAAVGCLGSNAPTTTTDAGGGAADATAPTAIQNVTRIADPALPLVGERGPVVSEKFYFGTDRKLHVYENASDAGPLAQVPEAFTGSAFFTAGPGSIPAWEGPPSQRAFEVTQDVTFTVRVTSAQPAVTVTKGLQFPPVGGWFGTKDRWAVYFSAADAPDSLEAGKTYTFRMTAKMPQSGYFHRVGEPLGIHAYLGYQTPDNSPVAYVVGGPDPAGFVMPHVHFNLSAPVETKVLDKSGALGPNPSVTTTTDPAPVLLPFDVPPRTAYVVAELVGAATGGNGDADLELMAGSDVLGDSKGPTTHEVVALGPTALAKAGGKLTAKVSSAMASGGTYKLVVTAYGQ